MIVRKMTVGMGENEAKLHAMVQPCTTCRDTHKPSVGGSIPPVDTHHRIEERPPLLRGPFFDPRATGVLRRGEIAWSPALPGLPGTNR